MPTCRQKIQAGDNKHALLSWTSDMACWSFSIPALDSCPFKMTDGDDAICASCYATLNRYNMEYVQKAQWGRFEWTKQTLRDDPDQWIKVMVDTIDSHVENGFFRVHDSGDLFSVAYVNAWRKVCESLPKIKFWFPTRSWRAKSDKWQKALTKLAALDNVTVRPSALRYGEKPPTVDGYSAGTTVYESQDDSHKGVKFCPKTVNGGSCEDNGCRTCWSDKKGVGYLVHGILGRHKPQKPSDKMLNGRKEIKSQYVGITVSAA